MQLRGAPSAALRLLGPSESEATNVGQRSFLGQWSYSCTQDAGKRLSSTNPD